MIKIKEDLLNQIKDKEALLTCYQCGKCSSFCPVFNLFPQKFNPRKLIEGTLIGYTDLVRKSVFLCTTCYECLENCPHGINLVDIVMNLRNLFSRDGNFPKEFKEEFKSLILYGTIYKESERIRRFRENFALSPFSDSGKEELKTLLNDTGILSLFTPEEIKT